MSEAKTYDVPAHYSAAGTRNSPEDYERRYAQSVQDPDTFWAEEGRIVDWIKPFTKVKDVSFNADDLHIRWFED
ncbi:acetyl-coenzyme A synthetase N-terminal domain-containing protein, partial [Acinetobacter baumannii]